MPKSVQLFIEIGHIAMCREKNKIEPWKTHDWFLFVRSKNNEQAFTDLVEKVVFRLHESFENPTRIVKTSPFELRESGYGIFTATLEVYFQWHEKTSHSFSHDITLPIEGGPSIEMTKTEKLIFEGVPDDFVEKILKCGGTLVSENKSSKLHKHHHDIQKSLKRKSPVKQITSSNDKMMQKKLLETSLFGDFPDENDSKKKKIEQDFNIIRHKEKHKKEKSHHKSSKESSHHHSTTKGSSKVKEKVAKKYEERGNSPSTPSFVAIPQSALLASSLQPPLMNLTDQSAKPRAIVGPFNDAPDIISSSSSNMLLGSQTSVIVRHSLEPSGLVKPNLNESMDNLQDSDDEYVESVMKNNSTIPKIEHNKVTKILLPEASGKLSNYLETIHSPVAFPRNAINKDSIISKKFEDDDIMSDLRLSISNDEESDADDDEVETLSKNSAFNTETASNGIPVIKLKQISQRVDALKVEGQEGLVLLQILKIISESKLMKKDKDLTINLAALDIQTINQLEECLASLS